jgi:hypothetical protein
MPYEFVCISVARSDVGRSISNSGYTGRSQRAKIDVLDLNARLKVIATAASTGAILSLGS